MVAWLEEIAYRPNSTCANTLITQPRIISHNKLNPACAPVLGVKINSPEPTIAAAIINPGPSRANTPNTLLGGNSIWKSEGGLFSDAADRRGLSWGVFIEAIPGWG